MRWRRPNIAVASDKYSRLYFLLALAGLVTSIIIPLWALPNLPAQVPMRFNAAGQVAAQGGKWTVLLLPAINLFIFGVMTITLHVPPRLYNFLWPITDENAPRQYALAHRLVQLLRLQMAWLFAFLAGEIVWVAQGNPPSGLSLLPAWIAAILITVAWYFVAAWRAR